MVRNGIRWSSRTILFLISRCGAINYLERDGIAYIGDPVQKTEDKIGRDQGRSRPDGLRLGVEAPVGRGLTDRF